MIDKTTIVIQSINDQLIDFANRIAYSPLGRVIHLLIHSYYLAAICLWGEHIIEF